MAGFSAIPGAVLRLLRCGRKSPGLAYRASRPLEAVRVRLQAAAFHFAASIKCTTYGTRTPAVKKPRPAEFYLVLGRGFEPSIQMASGVTPTSAFQSLTYCPSSGSP